MFPINVANLCGRQQDEVPYLPFVLANMIGNYILVESKEDFEQLHKLDPTDKVLAKNLSDQTMPIVPDIKAIEQALSLPHNNAEDIKVKYPQLVQLGMYYAAMELYKLAKTTLAIKDKQYPESNIVTALRAEGGYLQHHPGHWSEDDGSGSGGSTMSIGLGGKYIRLVNKTIKYPRYGGIDRNTTDILFDQAIQHHDFESAAELITYIHIQRLQGNEYPKGRTIGGRGLLWWINNGDAKQREFVAKYYDSFRPRPTGHEYDEAIIVSAYNKELYELATEALEHLLKPSHDDTGYTSVVSETYQALIPGLEEGFVDTFVEAAETTDHPPDGWLEAMEALKCKPEWRQRARTILMDAKVDQALVDKYIP